MDEYTYTHLQSWLERTVYHDEREEVEKLITEYVERFPWLLEEHGWSDIRRMAEKDKSGK